MRRLVMCAAGAIALALVAGPVALAHEEITPPTIPTGKAAFLTLSAANERRVDVNRVTVTPPAGTQFGHATRDPAGWTTSSFSHTEAVWTGGTIRPGRFESFGFDIEPAAQPGTIAFRVVLGYTDGSTTQAEVPVTVTLPAGAPAPTTVTTAGEEEVIDPPPPGTSTVNTADDDTLAVAAMAVSVLAVVVAIAAVVMARRGATPAPGGGAQDW